MKMDRSRYGRHKERIREYYVPNLSDHLCKLIKDIIDKINTYEFTSIDYFNQLVLNFYKELMIDNSPIQQKESISTENSCKKHLTNPDANKILERVLSYDNYTSEAAILQANYMDNRRIDEHQKLPLKFFAFFCALFDVKISTNIQSKPVLNMIKRFTKLIIKIKDIVLNKKDLSNLLRGCIFLKLLHSHFNDSSLLTTTNSNKHFKHLDDLIRSEIISLKYKSSNSNDSSALSAIDQYQKNDLARLAYCMKVFAL
jgi:hypothetical protein